MQFYACKERKMLFLMKFFQKHWNPGQIPGTVIKVDGATISNLILSYGKCVSLEWPPPPECTWVVKILLISRGTVHSHTFEYFWLNTISKDISSHAILKWVKIKWGHISRRKRTGLGHVAQSISRSMSLLRGVCIGFLEKQQREVICPRRMDSKATIRAAPRPYITGFFMESHTKETQTQLL